MSIKSADVDPLEGRRIGPHLQVRAGLLKAVERAHEIGATALQVFSDNPTAWRRRADLPADLPEFRVRLASYDIGPLSIHAPYLVNLCGADEDFWTKSVATMASELLTGAAYGASFVNMHVGSHKGLGREQGLRQLARGLRAVFESVAAAADAGPHPLPTLVLENSAGTGDGIGSSIDDLADIVDFAAAQGVESGFGFCLDTAHLWGAGYQIDSPAGVADLIAVVEARLGRERVVMLHLNDSRSACGSRTDRHEHVGAGQIGEDGIRAVLLHPWLATLPTYLETPGVETGFDAVNLERVRRLLRDEPLPALPPEAYEPRRRRSRKRVLAG
jgi:deoxyribonuclease-4